MSWKMKVLGKVQDHRRQWHRWKDEQELKSTIIWHDTTKSSMLEDEHRIRGEVVTIIRKTCCKMIKILLKRCNIAQYGSCRQCYLKDRKCLLQEYGSLKWTLNGIYKDEVVHNENHHELQEHLQDLKKYVIEMLTAIINVDFTSSMSNSIELNDTS